jgi:ABC-type spermidine/putrescine transport system permease subunit I
VTIVHGVASGNPITRQEAAQFAGLNNWPFSAAPSFVLMTAMLSLSLVSNVLVQRRYHR